MYVDGASILLTLIDKLTHVAGLVLPSRLLRLLYNITFSCCVPSIHARCQTLETDDNSIEPLSVPAAHTMGVAATSISGAKYPVLSHTPRLLAHLFCEFMANVGNRLQVARTRLGLELAPGF